MKRGVNVIIADNLGRILILKRSSKDESCPGLWDLPGGGVEKNETLQEAVKREVAEESGLKVKPESDYFYIYHYPKKIDKYAFRSTLIGGEVLLSKEHTEFKWISKDEWQSLEYIPSVKATLEEFFKQ